jgi:hypothetical protein
MLVIRMPADHNDCGSFRETRMIAMILLVLAALAPSTSTAPSTAPSSQPATQTSFPLEVIAVRGRVQYRNRRDENWQPVAAGMKFSRGGEVRIGVKSAVAVRAADGQTFTIEGLGVLPIEAVLQRPHFPTTQPVKPFYDDFDDTIGGRA